MNRYQHLALFQSLPTQQGNVGISTISQELADKQAAQMDANGCVNCVDCTECINCNRCAHCACLVARTGVNYVMGKDNV